MKIKHKTECLPGIVRSEIYETDDVKYVERFDEITGKRQYGNVFMYDDMLVCYVGEDGTIELKMPTEWVTNHNDMLGLISDLQKLDDFLAVVCEKYKIKKECDLENKE